MEIDKTTLRDLAIFDWEDELSVFNKIDFTQTTQGSDQLRQNLRSPLRSIEEIQAVQETIAFIHARDYLWPQQISNGTLMVAERLYESQVDSFPLKPSVVGAFSYKLLHGYDFSLIRYSLKHAIDFISGLTTISEKLSESAPQPLAEELKRIENIIRAPDAIFLTRIKDAAALDPQRTLEAAGFILYRFKGRMLDLIRSYARLDAWRSMGLAGTRLGFTQPHFIESEDALFEGSGLFHSMLAAPVAYDISLGEPKNFLFLTGANMAGKSTFIKACGIAVYLAHTGMSVPAKSLRLSFFDGLLSNINVIDNIAKGESYFYNEVKRIKATINKISDGKKWLILIDELFKGTNVEDAMRCSTEVINGLRKNRKCIFILSTHLYEIAGSVQAHDNIDFRFFETKVAEEKLSFNYKLKNGVSADRLGYVILEREGVVKMLKDL